MRLLLSLLLGFLTAADARAAFDAFLKITPAAGSPAIPGETEDPLYAGWVEIGSFEAGNETAATVDASVAGNVPPHMQIRKFGIVRKSGAATVPVFRALASGTVIQEIAMVVVAKGGTRAEVWDIRAKTCMFAGLTLEASTGGELMERLSFHAAEVEWTWMQTNAAGDPVAEIFASYSLINNSAIQLRTSRPPSYPGGVDSDSDGLPDGWELLYGLDRNTADASLDSDSDGFTNLQEFAAHTDPLQPLSGLHLTSVQQQGPGGHRITWATVAGLTYRVESAPAISGPWTAVRTITATTTGTEQTDVTTAQSRQFYRVVIP